MTRTHHEPIPPAMKGFEFRQRKERLNWRILSTIDVDKIINNVYYTPSTTDSDSD